MEESNSYLHSNVILQKKVPNYIGYYVLLHILFAIFLLVLFSICKIEKKTAFIGYYEKENIRIVVDSKFFDLTTKNVLIQEKSYSYQTNKIEVIAYEDGLPSLWEVWITLDLPEHLKIENNQISLSFIKEKTTILKQIIKQIKKGMNL